MDPVGPAITVRAVAATPPGVGFEALTDYWPYVIRVGWFLVGFLVVFVLGWYVLEPTATRLVDRRNRNNPTLQDAISRYLKLLVVGLAFVVGIGVAGYGGFLADSAVLLAAVTLAVSVAGQTVIGSVISGLVLVVDPEFNVGDYIEWDGGEGIVRSITLRVTRVQTPNGELVTIPNTELTGHEITRPYGRGRYRVVDRIGIAYEDDVGTAIEHLEAATDGIEHICQEPAPAAHVDEFGSDAVVLRVHYWIEDPSREDVFRVRSAYAQAAKERLDAAGVTIAPPSKRDLLGRIEVDEETGRRTDERPPES